MRPLPLLLAGVCAALASGHLTPLLQSSTGIDLHAVLAQAGVPLQLSVFALLAVLFLGAAFVPAKPRVYVLDFAVFAPPASWRFRRDQIRPLAEKHGKLLPEHIDFLEKIAYRTGLGDDTAVVPSVQAGDESVAGITTSREEFRDTCFPCISEVLEKTGVKASQIDFVVTNSSLFNPTPSLSTTVMNAFKMSSKCKGYSLGGMGCSAGVIAVDLAKELLELHPNSTVLVVSHENISNAFYAGKDPSMLLINVLFRANGCAVLLTNKPRDAGRSKYWIQHLVRTNLAADDVAFNCVIQTQDDEGVMGVRLNRDIVQVGTRALKGNMTSLGPLVLPLDEKLLFAGNMLTRKLASTPLKSLMPASWAKPYIPDFTKAFDYYCIHTGGRGIIDGLEKELKLSRPQVEPSRASLYRFGNTSSTSVWYELAYIEHFQGARPGAKVWQLAFGSGFKFNSNVMIANRNVRQSHKAWEGFDAPAMWVELDQLEASARAARAAKAKRAAEEAAAAAAAAEAAASGKPEHAPEVRAAAAAAASTVPDDDAGSAFASSAAGNIAEQLPDVVQARDAEPRVAGALSFKGSLKGSRSLRRMTSISRPNSLVAVGSGCVPAGDIHHLEEVVDVEVPEPQPSIPE